MKLREGLSILKKHIALAMVWDDVKYYIEERLDMGKIESVSKIESSKFYTCPGELPYEYCSKENIVDTFRIITDKGIPLVVKQGYYGINFEEPCDSNAFSIYNSNNELIYSSAETKQVVVK